MKPKPLLIISTLCILFLMAIGPLHAVDSAAVRNIDYLKGDDFVQLHFKIDKMIPIPDVFYPEKNNDTLIVMRLKDVPVELPKDRFNFDSSIIDYIEINHFKDIAQVDVKIHLKQQVNYRVFTNQKGLFIEFPNLKAVASVNEATATPVNSSPTPSVSTPTVAKKNSKDIQIKDIVLSEQDTDHVKFEILMTGQAEYSVIPIVEDPVRLAIDFKNTHSKQIKKLINQLNVKGVRGGLNSSSIYRVVFDLLYLKTYKVSPVNNALQVEFFANDVSEVTSKTQPLPSQLQNEPTPTETSPQILKNNTANPTVGDPGLISIKNEDFFEDEKSQVQSKEKTAEKTPVNPPESEKAKTEVKEQPSSDETPNSDSKKTLEIGGKIFVGERFTFNFHNADLKDVIKIITKMAGKNIVLDPAVTGRVSSQLTDVPWDQALDLFLKINNLAYVEEGNIIRIGRSADLAREAVQARTLWEAKQLEGEMTVVSRTISYAKVTEIAPLLRSQLSDRGEILMDPRTNAMIVSDVKARIEKMDKIIDVFDTPTPQVSIEARFVETRTNFVDSLGIQWGYNFAADSAHGNQTTLKFPNSININGNQIGGYAVNLPASTPTASTLFTFGNVSNSFKLDMALSAMASKGQVRIISSPKAITQNNKEAYIQNGRQIPFSSIQNNTVSIQWKTAALELKVTPQITAKETIICELEVNNNSVDASTIVVNQGVGITIQSIKTTVMVENGGTIVIGGIYQVENSLKKDSVPFLSRIPILGSLFKRSTNSNDQRELLIFITPRIVK